MNGYCAYFDVENAMDPSLAESMGVTTENLLLSRPSSAENLISGVNTLTKSGSVLLLIVSSLKSGNAFGHMDEVTCGGNALNFFAAVRLRIRRTGLLRTGNEVSGLGISVQVVKNKLAPAMKKAELRIRFGRGFSCESEVLDLACEHGIIMKEGSNYLIEGKVFSNELAAEKYLAENDGIFDKIDKYSRLCNRKDWSHRKSRKEWSVSWK
ncbi:hypothetical protein FNV43_RR15923 [Rhamnella rubrinervis]|uniref:RecA family profile 2 domain-containing protein n=1 Tax=Rhamnella rubrinervis TaxID=2594499 RepID=A0A8K0E2D6_9ROSA|nr:hypothetical protein FNV43_RR15923 [Rhamnella rubrinervis]